jgi:hypothetical protein
MSCRPLAQGETLPADGVFAVTRRLDRARDETAPIARRRSTGRAGGKGHRAELKKTMPNEFWSEEQTDSPLYADEHNFYKLEKWTKDGSKVDRLLYAGNNLKRARELFADAVKHRPRIRLTIRQRTRIVEQWPQ